MGEKSIENGIYMAVTDAPVPLRFNISDLSTLGKLVFYSSPFGSFLTKEESSATFPFAYITKVKTQICHKIKSSKLYMKTNMK